MRLPLCVRCVDKSLFSFGFQHAYVFKRFSFCIRESVPFRSKCDATALNGVCLDREREFSNIPNGGFLTDH